MGIPETIVAAGIGGAATVTAALFHLYTALRVKSGHAPKKTGPLRSSLGIFTLMIASAAGGYVYAEFKQQQALDDARAVHDELRAMRDEINAQLLVLAQTTGRLVQDRAVDGHADIEAAAVAPYAVDDRCGGGDAPKPCEAAAPTEVGAVAPLANDVAL